MRHAAGKMILYFVDGTRPTEQRIRAAVRKLQERGFAHASEFTETTQLNGNGARTLLRYAPQPLRVFSGTWALNVREYGIRDIGKTFGAVLHIHFQDITDTVPPPPSASDEAGWRKFYHWINALFLWKNRWIRERRRPSLAA